MKFVAGLISFTLNMCVLIFGQKGRSNVRKRCSFFLLLMLTKIKRRVLNRALPVPLDLETLIF